jgi:hypothetical protein
VASWEGPAPVAVLGSIAELPALALEAPTCTGT